MQFPKSQPEGDQPQWGTEKGKILFIEGPAGALERWLEEVGEPVSDPSSPPQGPPDLDKLQASAQRTGGMEFA